MSKLVPKLDCSLVRSPILVICNEAVRKHCREGLAVFNFRCVALHCLASTKRHCKGGSQLMMQTARVRQGLGPRVDHRDSERLRGFG